MGGSESLAQAKELFRQGVDKSQKGDHAEAVQAFNQALQLNLDDADADGYQCVVSLLNG